MSARAFKRAVYRLCESAPLGDDARLCGQLRQAAASAASQVAEGFGRFNPLDFARFLGIGKASLMEAQNHLHDAVDLGYISEGVRQDHHELAQVALRDIIALLRYLQSPEAKHNAIEARHARKPRRTPNPDH